MLEYESHVPLFNHNANLEATYIGPGKPPTIGPRDGGERRGPQEATERQQEGRRAAEARRRTRLPWEPQESPKNWGRMSPKLV